MPLAPPLTSATLSLSLIGTSCRRDRPTLTAFGQKRHESPGGAAEVAAPPMDEHHRHREPHGGGVEGAQGAQAKLLVHAALRQEPEAEPRFDQSLLRGEAVDRDEVGAPEPERRQPFGEQPRVRLAGGIRPHRKRHPRLAGQRARPDLAGAREPMAGRADGDQRLAVQRQRDEVGIGVGEVAACGRKARPASVRRAPPRVRSKSGRLDGTTSMHWTHQTPRRTVAPDRGIVMVSNEFLSSEIVAHGAYVCVRDAGGADVRRAGAGLVALAERLGLHNEFTPGHGPERESFALLRRRAATPGDIADDGVLQADWIVHVVSRRADAVAELCGEAAKALSPAARVRVLGGVVQPRNYTSAAMNNWAYARQVVQQPGGVMP